MLGLSQKWVNIVAIMHRLVRYLRFTREDYPNLTGMRHQNDRDASVQALNDRIYWRAGERYNHDRGEKTAITIRIYVKNGCASAAIVKQRVVEVTPVAGSGCSKIAFRQVHSSRRVEGIVLCV
jgi:hypothetical protein